jgi:hypothetical protein
MQVMHSCKAAPVSSLPVREMFGQQVAWEGVVATFDLTGHAKAKRAIPGVTPTAGKPGWSPSWRFPPLVSPQTAVQVAIAAAAKTQ